MSSIDAHELSKTRQQWVEDDWHDSYRGAPIDGTAWVDSPRGGPRVLRGGAFYDPEGGVRAALRGRFYPVGRSSSVGFRVVVSPFFSDL